jgi:hypothetical protein
MSSKKQPKNKVNMITKIQSIMDENKENFKDGDYKTICDLLLEEYKTKSNTYKVTYITTLIFQKNFAYYDVEHKVKTIIVEMTQDKYEEMVKNLKDLCPWNRRSQSFGTEMQSILMLGTDEDEDGITLSHNDRRIHFTNTNFILSVEKV